ncbi:MAG: single-stranded-DNA-specific exonuclease RecJ, partial [Pseudomonadota bacterium]
MTKKISAEGAFLEVARSLGGRRWNLRPADDRSVRTLRQSHDLDPVVARLLVARGITSAEASDYLTPTLRSLMPDPSVLKDMDKA